MMASSEDVTIAPGASSIRVVPPGDVHQQVTAPTTRPEASRASDRHEIRVLPGRSAMAPCRAPAALLEGQRHRHWSWQRPAVGQ